ncbi:hypothetical protein EYF80_022814 [Liparis tanakae]|uniref:Uncharacterized protein n=1 Tax=Liparis tanakae TaxID=230148 RepID=A0A4Z2HNC0_9TELE|nr:hypothetical protein EYF80_022814 [Liparis tanakae]
MERWRGRKGAERVVTGQMSQGQGSGVGRRGQAYNSTALQRKQEEKGGQTEVEEGELHPDQIPDTF